MWKILQFLSSIKIDAHEIKLVPFFLPHGVDRFTVLCLTQYKKLCYRRRTTQRAVRQSKSCQLLHNCIATSCTTNEVTDLEYHRRRTCNKLHVYIGRLVAQHSGRTSVSDRRTFPVLRSTCSWWVTTYVGKPSATGQPTRPTQPFIISG